jgi:hypothetical protein
MSDPARSQPAWAPIEVQAYVAPLWGGAHRVVAPRLSPTGGPGIGALLGPLRVGGHRSAGRGLRIGLLAPDSLAGGAALAREAAAAVEAALFDDAAVRALLQDGPGADGLRALPVLRLGLWAPIVWGALLLLSSGGQPVVVLVALWLLAGLPLCVAWYRRRRRQALMAAAHLARQALRGQPPVRVLHHSGLAELRGVIDAASDQDSAYRAAMARCAWCGVPALEDFYAGLLERARPSSDMPPVPQDEAAPAEPAAASAPAAPAPQPAAGDGA